MMKKTAYIALITVFVFLLGSCGPNRHPKKTGYRPAPELKTDFETLTASYSQWTDVSMPVKVELEAPKRMSVSGKATMVHGKSVHLSMRFLGIEVGSVFIGTDSVFIIAKMQRMAYAESLDIFRREFGFTLDDIQSLLLGQAFDPGKGTVTAAAAPYFETGNSTTPGSWILTPTKTPEGVSWHFEATRSADGLESVVNALIVAPDGMKPLTAHFSGHQTTGAGMTASEVAVEASLRGKPLKLNIIWNLNRAEWNEGIAPSYPKIPSDYRRITTKGLTDLLKKL